MKLSTWMRTFAVCVAAAAGTAASAQEREGGPVEITAFAGYDLNADVDLGTGSLRVDDAPSYGAVLDYAVRPGKKIELLWVYSTTTARFDSYSLSYPGSRSFGVDSHYFQIGGVNEFGRGGRVVPFLVGTIGAALFVPEKISFDDGQTISPDDTWRFAFTAGLGVKIPVGRKLGIRLEARFQAPLYFSGAGFYAGTGGSGMTVSGGMPYFQGDFTAGLSFNP